jgi:hypothetical protein
VSSISTEEINLQDYYVHVNSGNAAFVKEALFFIEQGGLTELWGKRWVKVKARSIEHARSLAHAAVAQSEKEKG